jgi:hypothetical protein
MLNGDISNRAGKTFAFRYEDFMVTYEDGGSVFSKAKNFVNDLIFGKEKRAVVNDRVRRVMHQLYRFSDYNVAVVMEDSTFLKLDERWLEENFTFGKVYGLGDELTLDELTLSGDITYYVDDNEARRAEVVPLSCAVSLAEVTQFIGRGRPVI